MVTTSAKKKPVTSITVPKGGGDLRSESALRAVRAGQQSAGNQAEVQKLDKLIEKEVVKRESSGGAQVIINGQDTLLTDVKPAPARTESDLNKEGRAKQLSDKQIQDNIKYETLRQQQRQRVIADQLKNQGSAQVYKSETQDPRFNNQKDELTNIRRTTAGGYAYAPGKGVLDSSRFGRPYGNEKADVIIKQARQNKAYVYGQELSSDYNSLRYQAERVEAEAIKRRNADVSNMPRGDTPTQLILKNSSNSPVKKSTDEIGQLIGTSAPKVVKETVKLGLYPFKIIENVAKENLRPITNKITQNVEGVSDYYLSKGYGSKYLVASDSPFAKMKSNTFINNLNQEDSNNRTNNVSNVHQEINYDKYYLNIAKKTGSTILGLGLKGAATVYDLGQTALESPVTTIAFVGSGRYVLKSLASINPISKYVGEKLIEGGVITANYINAPEGKKVSSSIGLFAASQLLNPSALIKKPFQAINERVNPRRLTYEESGVKVIEDVTIPTELKTLEGFQNKNVPTVHATYSNIKSGSTITPPPIETLGGARKKINQRNFYISAPNKEYLSDVYKQTPSGEFVKVDYASTPLAPRYKPIVYGAYVGIGKGYSGEQKIEFSLVQPTPKALIFRETLINEIPKEVLKQDIINIVQYQSNVAGKYIAAENIKGIRSKSPISEEGQFVVSSGTETEPLFKIEDTPGYLSGKSTYYNLKVYPTMFTNQPRVRKIFDVLTSENFNIKFRETKFTKIKDITDSYASINGVKNNGEYTPSSNKRFESSSKSLSLSQLNNNLSKSNKKDISLLKSSSNSTSVSPSPSRSVSPSRSTSPSISRSPSFSKSPSISRSPSISTSPSISISPSTSKSPSPSRSVSPSPSISVSPSPSRSKSPSPSPSISRVPRPPRYPILSRSSDNSVLSNQAYTLEEKRFGKYRTISTGLTRGKALQLGVRRTSQTLGATFRIRPTGTTTQKDINYTPSNIQYREYKIKGGRKVATPDTFIQRNKYRLSNPLERREIQIARGRLI